MLVVVVHSKFSATTSKQKPNTTLLVLDKIEPQHHRNPRNAVATILTTANSERFE
jgi:hypothetical protein